MAIPSSFVPDEATLPPSFVADSESDSSPRVTDAQKAYAPGVPKPPLPEALKSDAEQASSEPIRIDPRTGLRYREQPMGQNPLDFPYRAVTAATQGVEALAPSNPNESIISHALSNPKDAARGGTELLKAGLEAATPALAAGAVAAPISTVIALAAGTIAQKGVEAGLNKLGVAPEYRDLAGTIAGLIAGYAAGGAEKLTPEQHTLVEVLQGKANPEAEGRTVDALRSMVDRGATVNEQQMAQAALKRKFGIEYGPDFSKVKTEAPPAPESFVSDEAPAQKATTPASFVPETPAESPTPEAPAAPETPVPAPTAYAPGQKFDTPSGPVTVKGTRGDVVRYGTPDGGTFQVTRDAFAKMVGAAQPATETNQPAAETPAAPAVPVGPSPETAQGAASPQHVEKLAEEAGLPAGSQNSPVEQNQQPAAGKVPETSIQPAASEPSVKPEASASISGEKQEVAPHDFEGATFAEPESKEVSGTVETGTAPHKPLYEMDGDELDGLIKDQREADKTLLSRLFGEVGGKKYANLERASNNINDHARADAAYAEMEKMQESLSEAQRNKLFGIGEPDVVDIDAAKSARNAIGRIDGDTPAQLGDSLKWAVSRFDPDNPHVNPEVYAQLRRGFQIAQEQGWNTAQVMESAYRGAAARFRDPEDAAFILEKFFNPARPEGAQPAPKGVIEAPKAEEVKKPHEFSSTQVNLPPALHEAFSKATAAIPDSDLEPDRGSSYGSEAELGRETEPHITVKFGLHDEEPSAVKKILADEGPITAKLGKMSVFKIDGADVVKLDVESPDLHRLNKAIAELPNGDTHPVYQPHATLAYVKPGEGAKYVGKEAPGLTGKTVTFGKVQFSAKDRTKTDLPLEGVQSEHGEISEPTKTTDEGAAIHGPRQPSHPVARGEATDIVVEGRERPYKAHYAVRELSDTYPSHNPFTFETNPDYHYHNDRDYSLPANRARVAGNSGTKFNPNLIVNDNPDATNGPSIIEANGNVLGGNNRRMTLERVYSSNPTGAKAYRDLLVKKAAQFGVDPDTVKAMDRPVLVREIDEEELNPQRAITDLNKAPTAELSTGEQAAADARSLTPETSKYIGSVIEGSGPDATLSSVLDGKRGPDVVNHLIKAGIFTEAERPELLDAKAGTVTKAAKDRISKMLLGSLFRDSEQFQSAEPSLRNKLERIAPILKQLEGNDGWDLTPDVKQAIEGLSFERDFGKAYGMKPGESFLIKAPESVMQGEREYQSSMFGGDDEPVAPKMSTKAKELADFIRGNTANTVTRAFRSFAEKSNEPGLFGAPEPSVAFRQSFGSESGVATPQFLNFLLTGGKGGKNPKTAEEIAKEVKGQNYSEFGSIRNRISGNLSQFGSAVKDALAEATRLDHEMEDLTTQFRDAKKLPAKTPAEKATKKSDLIRLTHAIRATRDKAIQLRRSSNLDAALYNAAAWKGKVSAIMYAATQPINEALKGTAANRKTAWDGDKPGDYQFEDLAAGIVQSRLMGIKDFYEGLAEEAEKASDEDLRKSFQANFGNILEAIEGRAGLSSDLKDMAANYVEKGEYDDLRHFLSDTFNDASYRVADIMPSEEWQQMNADPQVQKALAIYKGTAEASMKRSHLDHEGVLSSRLGPWSTYYPMTAVEAPDEAEAKELDQTVKKIHRAAILGHPYTKPKNIHNNFASGLSPAYDVSIPAFRKALTGIVRLASKYKGLEELEDSGWAYEPARGADPTIFVDPFGNKWPAARMELSPAKLVFLPGSRKPMLRGATIGITPKWLKDEIDPIFDQSRDFDAPTNKIKEWINGANTLAVTGLMEPVFHSKNVLGALVSNTPFIAAAIGKDAMHILRGESDQVTGILNGIFGTISREEFAKDLIKMAGVGVLPDRFGSSTYSKQVAEEMGIKKAAIVHLGVAPLIFGSEGLDVLSRWILYKTFDRLQPGWTPREMNQFVNQLGSYVNGLQGKFERAMKGSGMDPFATAAVARLRRGVGSITGGPTPGRTTGEQAMWRGLKIMTVGAIGYLIYWALTYKAVTGKWPMGDPRAEAGYIPIDRKHGRYDWWGLALWGKGPELGRVGLNALDGDALTGMKMFGLPGAFATRQRGGNATQTAASGVAQSANEFLGAGAGPIPRAASAALGMRPSLSGFFDNRGATDTSFLRSIPKNANRYTLAERMRMSGLPAQTAWRGSAALGELNPFFHNIGQNVGLLDTDPADKTAANNGAQNAFRMGLQLLVPSAVGTAYNPYASETFIRRQRAGMR